MKGIIMAGGEGTRLRPITCSIPKPLVNMAGKPVMEHIINLLKFNGIKDIAATLHYLPEKIKDYFKDGSSLGINLNYFIEEVPLGTGGSVLNAMDFIDGTFIVISGDALTDLNIMEAVNFHKKSGSLSTLILKRVDYPLEYGIVITDGNGRIKRFLEKPGWGEVFSDTANTGIYILEPEIFSYYKKGDNFDFSKDLFPKLLKDNVPMYGYITSSYWSDIGDISSYMESNFDILKGKVNLPYMDKALIGNAYIHKDVVIPENTVIEPPVIIGRGLRLSPNTHIGPYAIIGENCSIENNSSVKKSILFNNVNLGKNTQVRGSVICTKTAIKDNVDLFEGSVIGDESVVMDKSEVKQGIKIWPSKIVPEGSVINRNLVWGVNNNRNFFGNRGILGEVNVDITPEFLSMLGCTFPLTLKGNPFILSGCDGSSQSEMVRKTIESGILSSGFNTINTDSTLLPAIRYGIRFFNASGGYFVKSIDGFNRVKIEFFNNLGGNLDRAHERKIENIIARGDFQRAKGERTGAAVDIRHYDYIYITKSSSFLNNNIRIKKMSPKILIASKSNKIVEMLYKVLSEYGASPYSYTLTDDLNSVHRELLSGMVLKNGFNIGFVIGNDGEGISIIDNKGNFIEDQKYNALCSLILLSKGNKNIYRPYNSSRIIDRMAENFNSKVLYTKTSDIDFLNEVLKDEALLPDQYVLNFDGISSIFYILNYLTMENLTLSNLMNKIPPIYYKESNIQCSYDSVGRILRRLIEHSKDNVEMFEGVKLKMDKGWGLVLPDNEKPMFRIYAEGSSEEFAEEIVNELTDKIERYLNNFSEEA